MFGYEKHGGMLYIGGGRGDISEIQKSKYFQYGGGGGGGGGGPLGAREGGRESSNS